MSILKALTANLKGTLSVATVTPRFTAAPGITVIVKL
jgi:hypothetical protein